MVAAFYSKNFDLDFLRKRSFIDREGVSLLALAGVAQEIGFNTLKAKLNAKSLLEDAPLPCILHWNKKHFVVLYKVKRNKKGEIQKLFIADPAVGLVTMPYYNFCNHWIGEDGGDKGFALILEPAEDFLEARLQQGASEGYKTSLGFMARYFLRYRRYFAQVVIGMLGASILSLLMPFFTQSIVDIGIESGDFSFIFLMLLFQLFFFFGTTAIEFIQNQLLLHISARINISIVSDFLSKLMRLPARFFDSKNAGDIITRINDQKRIENFVTSVILRTVFSALTFVVFMIVLAVYNTTILVIFLGGSALAFAWTILFMERRRSLDYRLFSSSTANSENIFEIINGMQEIKINQFELYKKWQWQKLQARLFKLNISSLKLEQYQGIGTIFFTQAKNILITYTAATAVVNGEITLGMMLSISFIIGQLNSPVDQFISFFKLYQHAKFSIERMGEVYREADEEDMEGAAQMPNVSGTQQAILKANGSAGIWFNQVNFTYGGPNSPKALKSVSFHIPIGKTTAIVGTSGSGKTTIVKLLLKFYEPQDGSIKVNGTSLTEVSAKWWRRQCGIVMQDGYLFSDTIERNIVMGEDVDEDWLKEVCRLACLDQLLGKLPLGLQTKIGKSGTGLSGGEQQRILIARALYKDPPVLILDEAVSFLDTRNERMITKNLNEVYANKTAIIVAHRLSTVKNADQIIVIDNGKIVESGTHPLLVEQKGHYFNLIKDQLELNY